VSVRDLEAATEEERDAPRLATVRCAQQNPETGGLEGGGGGGEGGECDLRRINTCRVLHCCRSSAREARLRRSKALWHEGMARRKRDEYDQGLVPAVSQFGKNKVLWPRKSILSANPMVVGSSGMLGRSVEMKRRTVSATSR